MMIVNPDDEKSYKDFLVDWRSHYPDTTRSIEDPVTRKKIKKTEPGLKPPSIVTMRILYQYATFGDIPGENVLAMLTGALYETFNTSPREELDLINSSVQYITTYLPCECWGNPEKYGKWINKMRRSKSGRQTEHY